MRVSFGGTRMVLIVGDKAYISCSGEKVIKNAVRTARVQSLI
jgi:hypothetical protein